MSAEEAPPRVHLEDAVRLGPAVYLTLVWQQRRTVATIVAVTGLLTLAATFLVKTTYRATNSFIAASAMSGEGGMSFPGALEGVTGRFGLRLNGGDDLGELFPRLLRSRTLLERVLSRPLSSRDGGVDSLISWLRPKGRTEAARRDHALRKLRDRLIASLDSRTSVVTVSVTLSDPVLAAATANACVQELDSFVGAARRTQSSRQAEFIAGRIEEVNAQLEIAETTLRDFRERNRRIADSPELLLQESRLMRDVDVAQRLFMELKTQQEIVKIEQVRDVPLITMLDRAEPPVRKHAPQRLRLLVSAAVIGFLASLVVVVARDARDPRPEAAVRSA